MSTSNSVGSMDSGGIDEALGNLSMGSPVLLLIISFTSQTSWYRCLFVIILSILVQRSSNPSLAAYKRPLFHYPLMSGNTIQVVFGLLFCGLAVVCLLRGPASILRYPFGYRGRNPLSLFPPSHDSRVTYCNGAMSNKKQKKE